MDSNVTVPGACHGSILPELIGYVKTNGDLAIFIFYRLFSFGADAPFKVHHCSLNPDASTPHIPPVLKRPRPLLTSRPLFAIGTRENRFQREKIPKVPQKVETGQPRRPNAWSPWPGMI